MRTAIQLAIALLALVAIQAKAETPAEVCRKIAQINSNRGAQCAALISRHRFSENAGSICMIAANSSSQGGLSCMEAAADRYISHLIVPTCKKWPR
ncbi:MAG: hypothetical protein R2827_13430 [Bdellovibrionales bacterium]